MSLFSIIRDFLKKHIFSRFSSKALVGILTALCVIALMLQYFTRSDSLSVLTIAGAAVVPFQTGINEIGGFLFSSEEKRRNLKEAQDEIESLENENADLTRKVDDLNSLAIENEELRGLLSAKERLSDYEMVEADVIGNDGLNCFERFTIDLGQADGIKTDMNVIDQDGLVGIVTYVGLNYSIVTSIIEDGTNVSVMTRNGHENCIVKGDLSESGSDHMLLQEVSADVDLEKDATLVTSYISDKYLSGLTVGYVADIEEDENHLTQSGTIVTAADFTKIHHVLVITTMKETQEETENE